MIGRLLLRLFAWLALGYLVLPLVVIVGSSVTASQFLAFPPRGVTFAWYRSAFSDPSYVAAFVTSTVLASSATVVAVLLAIPASLAIARFTFPGKALLSALLMSPMALPQVVIGAALLQFCAAFDLMRTFAALLIGHVVIVTPFVLRSVLPHLTPEQRSLEEASMDLGAGPVATFFHVILPQIKSGV